MSKEKGDLKTKESVYKSLQVVFRSVDVVSVLLMSLFSGVTRCFGVLLASWVLWCPLCSVVLSPFSVSFLFNKVSLFESVVLGPIPHQTWRVQSLPLLLWTPVLPQMSGTAGRDFDLTASVVCVCFSCDWIAYIHPGCWQSRAWAVLLGRLASLLTGPLLLSGHSFSCFKLVACLKVLESPLHRPQPL